MEDEYEYACARTERISGEFVSDRQLIWEDRKSAEAEVNLMGGGKSRYWNYILVKRRKAGPMERVVVV